MTLARSTLHGNKTSKWHDAAIWAANDCFYLTACGQLITRSASEVRGAVPSERLCRKCIARRGAPAEATP